MSNDSDLDWYRKVGDIACYIEYYYITPVYFIFGLLGHLIFICALYKQAQTEKAYIYQIFVVVSETFEIITFFLFVTSFEWWSGMAYKGAKWYQSCYLCMCYSTYVSIPFVNSFITTSLMLSISMTIDRILALAKPFAYKQFNHGRNQIVTLSVCIIIGFGTSMYQCFEYELKYDELENVYKLNLNEVFIANFLCIFFGHFRNAVRIFGILLIFVCNILLLYFFHQKPALFSQTTTQEKKKREKERTLAVMSVCSSLFNMIGMSFLISYYIWEYTSSKFRTSIFILYQPITNAMVQITDLADFYLLVVISKSFRKMIVTSLPCFGKCVHQSSVAPAVHEPINKSEALQMKEYISGTHTRA